MTKKKLTYIDSELDYLEVKLLELKEYIDARPLTTLEDRIGFKVDKSGNNIPYVIATIETQRKDLTAARKEYAELVSFINEKREQEAKKLKTRGDKQVSILAKSLINNRESTGN